MDEFFEVILSSVLFANMTDADVRKMLTCLNAHVARFDKHAYVLSSGERARAVGLALDGRAHIVKEDFWGNRVIVSEVRPGELYAEAFACALEPLTVSVVAAEPLTVLQLDIERMLHVCTSACAFHGALVTNLMKVLAQKNLRLTGKVTHMACKTTRDKLLSYLLECAQAARSSTFEIPFDRQQLADYLSVNRSAMSAELGKMREEGILKVHKKRFTLVEGERLGGAAP